MFYSGFYIRIQASDQVELHRRISAFGYLAYRSQGRGAVFLSEAALEANIDGSLAATVQFVPRDAPSKLFKPEHIASIDAYHPEREYILALVNDQQILQCMRMAPHDIRETPKALGEEWAMGELAMPWLPGQVLTLERPLPGMPTGQYVFTWRDGANLHFKAAAKGKGGDPAGKLASTHLDSAKWFRPMEQAGGSQ
jgi:hypothetical protein